MFVPPEARFSHLLSLPEGENIGKAINDAMKAVEAENAELKGVLPKSYTRIDNLILVSLLMLITNRAVPRTHLRPGVWIGWDVRSECRVHQSPPE